MTIDDLKPSIIQLSRDEAFAIHSKIRANRLVSKRKVERKKAAKRTPASLLAGLDKDTLNGLIKELEASL